MLGNQYPKFRWDYIIDCPIEFKNEPEFDHDILAVLWYERSAGIPVTIPARLRFKKLKIINP